MITDVKPIRREYMTSADLIKPTAGDAEFQKVADQLYKKLSPKFDIFCKLNSLVPVSVASRTMQHPDPILRRKRIRVQFTFTAQVDVVETKTTEYGIDRSCDDEHS